MQTNTFWLKFGGLSLAVTLKIRSRSPKPIQLFIMSKCYIHANLVKILQLVHKILGTQAPFGSNLADLSPAVTLKNRSRSPKPNQLFIMSQCYIHANLVENCQTNSWDMVHRSTFWLKGQGSRRVKIGPVAEIYDFLICCRIIYLMKKNVIFICFALKLCDIEADK